MPRPDSRPKSTDREPAARDAGFPAPADADPNHHLWRNGRLWWIAFTVHRGHKQERIRFSLGTPDVDVARWRRDQVFALYEKAADCKISIRLKPRRVRAAGSLQSRRTTSDVGKSRCAARRKA